jgi:hypothetical protein
MSQLAKWQQAFVTGILNTPEQLDTPDVRAKAIYANNLIHTQRNALATSFPVTSMMLGAEGFAKAALEYLYICPKSTFDWAEYGEHFAAFLAQQETLSEHQVIPDMAHYEWLTAQANRADNIHCELSSLALIQSKPSAEVALVCSPGLCYVHSKYDLPALHKGHLSGELSRELFCVSNPQSWLIHRPNTAPQSWPIPPHFVLVCESLFSQPWSYPYIALESVLSRCNQYGVDVSDWLTTLVQANLITGAHSR